MPVAPITPDPGADGWGRPTPGPPSSMPPDADPDGVYRPAAVGGHRTARWFILVGVALVLLVAPLAVPMNDAEDTGDAEPYLLNDAAADTLTAWEASPLDLAGLDQRCVATGEALLPGTLEAECTSGYGTGPVDLDIVSMAGVEDAPLSAGRGLRAILASDVSDVPFRPAAAEDVLHPSLSAQTGEFLMSPVIGLSSPFADLPDLREPGMPGDTQPVQYGDMPRESPGIPATPESTPGVYTVAASFMIDGPDGVLYTLAVTGADEASVTVTAEQLWGAVRAA